MFLAPASYAARIERFGADKVARFAALRTRFGDPDLTSLIARYDHRLI